jgi:hypothetical protein
MTETKTSPLADIAPYPTRPEDATAAAARQVAANIRANQPGESR